MSDRHTIFTWSERGAIADVRAALAFAGVLPAARDWRAFLDALLLWSGAVALAAAVVFFIAHNWNDVGRFAKFGFVELLLMAAVIGYWRLGPDRATGKASLLVAAILLGVLLALFGQTYQTGADTWELFANWAVLMVPWVLIGRFAGLWMLLIAIANVSIVFYFQLIPSFFWAFSRTERLFWALYAFNTVALVGWELAAQRVAWLDERWAPRLLTVASGTTITLLMLQSIFDWQEASKFALFAYPVWLVCVYGTYRVLMCDLLVLAGGCLSLIVVVTAFLAKIIIDCGADAGSLFFIALVVVAMAAASGWRLKQVASEARK